MFVVLWSAQDHSKGANWKRCAGPCASSLFSKVIWISTRPFSILFQDQLPGVSCALTSLCWKLSRHALWARALGLVLSKRFTFSCTGTFGRPGSPEHRTFGARWLMLIEELVRSGNIKLHPLEVREGGLASIPANLEDFRVGNVKAKKLIVPLVAWYLYFVWQGSS